ncbi:22300_t:CDS:2, partial [Racocetra persica]
GIRVDENTISYILKTREERLNSEVINPDAKRHRAVNYPELDLALREFLLAEGLEIPQEALQFSNGWLEKFKDQNRIRQRHLEREAESADEIAISNTLPMLKDKCSNYPVERIYNMDETGLFYRLEPDRTLATRRLSGRKMSKERLSIALCMNADGSHKLVPFVIGKYAKPCCFKNINIKNLAVKYRNSARAWMITSLFQDWLKDFDFQMGIKHQGERVLLIPDN